MLFNDIENPFGADAFATPATIKVKPSPRLPKVKAGTRVLRRPTPPSTIIKKFLLS